MTLHPNIEKAIEETKAAVMELAEERNRLAAENEKMKGYIEYITIKIENQRADHIGYEQETFSEWKVAQ